MATRDLVIPPKVPKRLNRNQSLFSEPEIIPKVVELIMMARRIDERFSRKSQEGIFPRSTIPSRYTVGNT